MAPRSLRLSGGGIFNAVEFKGGRSFQIPSVVYVRGAEIEIDVTFANSSLQTLNVTVSVNDARLAIPPYPGNENWTYVALSDDGPYELSIPGAGGLDQTTMTFSSLPEYVCRGTLQVDMVATKNGNTVWSTGGWAGWETVYATLASPQNHQEFPWIDVLEFGCVWAMGLDDANECAEATTLKLFDASLFTYNLNEPGVPSNYYDEETELYDLTGFLEDIKPAAGNCVDVSTFNGIVLNALGVVVMLKQEVGDFESEPALYVTNLVCPIGTDRTESGNYRLIKFLMHQQSHVYAYVYDAALAYLVDLDGETYMLPAVGWHFWPFAHYWQRPTTEPVYGHAKRYYYQNVDSPTIDPDIPNEVVDYQEFLFTYSGVI